MEYREYREIEIRDALISRMGLIILW